MQAPKSNIAREIFADRNSATRLLEAIHKDSASIQFKGRKIKIRKYSESVIKALANKTPSRKHSI
jgi:translation initiation factor IF-3